MYSENSDVLGVSGLTAAQLQDAAEKIHANNGFNDFQGFVDLETKYGINAVFALAHAAVESAWGTSEIAVSKNNLYGFNADTNNPGNASSYPSQAASIDFYGAFIKQYYLTPGGVYYNGPTIHDMFIKYSTSDTPQNEADDEAEDETIAGIMNNIVSKISVGGNPAPAPVAVPVPATHNTLEIQKGDTFWGLEVSHNWVHGTLESLNPGVNPSDLQIGQTIIVPGAAAPSTATYIIRAGDTFWALETAHGWAHGTLIGLNPGVNPNDLQIGETVRIP